MILIIGGAYSGKRAYALSLGYAEDQIANAELDDRPVLDNLQDLLQTNELSKEMLDALCSHEIVICAELGSGIVPASAQDRAWRERVGRACIELAANADGVIRVVCGIPQAVKGELPCSS